MMAVPGETSCRAVSPCGDGLWGDIPVEATSQHVDGSYTGGFSDGTPVRPWTTIQEGVDAALPGAIVAVAAGTYDEDVRVIGKPVRLWGRCPSLVTIVGSADATASLNIGVQGAMARGLGLTGGSRGLAISAALEITLQDLWIHDTAGRGLEVSNIDGPATLQAHNLLIEGPHEHGLALGSVEGVFDGVVIRGTTPSPSDPTASIGAILIGVVCPFDDCTAAKPSDVTIIRSVVEGSQVRGGDIRVRRSSATIVDSVIRDVMAAPDGPINSIGINVHPSCVTDEGCLVDMPSHLTLRGSVIERYRGAALRAAGADVVMDRVTIRGASPQAGNAFDTAVALSAPLFDRVYFEAPSLVTLRQSLIDDATVSGVRSFWSHLALEGSAIRRTKQYGSQGGGFGVIVNAPCPTLDCGEAPLGSLTMNDSLVDENASTGVLVNGAVLTMDGSIVRGTEPVFHGGRGFGVIVQAGCDSETCNPADRGSALITNSVIEANHEVGIGALSADVRVEQSIVRGTRSGESAGHGVLAAPLCVTPTACLTESPGVAAVYGSILEQNHGDGMFAVGAIGHLEGSVVRKTLTNSQGRFGDGVVLLHFGHPADGVLLGNRFEGGARVGVANYGSRLVLEANRLGCHRPAYALEASNGVDPHVSDRGDNRCFCLGLAVVCSEAKYELDAPPPVNF